MDTLSHGLWGQIAVYKKYENRPKLRFAAFVIGMLPDLLAFTPLFLYLLFSGRFGGPESWEFSNWATRWAPLAYQYTHSLVIFAVTYLLVYLLRGRRHPWVLWPWALHIALDIPTHPDFYQTPFLFPLSDYRFSGGVSWGTPAIFITNWVLLAGWYGYWFFVLRKRSKLITN